jgi:hypothetical protein
MKHRVIGILAVAVVFAAVPSAAWADAGSPGTTFPEQPGSNVQTACTAVTTGPSMAENQSPTASAITAGLVEDACFGG